MEPSGKSAKADQTLGVFAGKVIREHLLDITHHEGDVLRGEVEAIHDMRVGIRRMRVALSNFSGCISKDDRTRLEVSLKMLAESLGKVRDLDVLIGSLNSQKRKLAIEDHQALSSLVKRIKVRRRRNMKTLAKYIRGPQFGALKMEPVEFQAPSENREVNGETI